MNPLRVLLPLGAGFAFTLADGEKITFRPEAGSTVSKTFTTGGEYDLDELSLLVNGEDVGANLPDFEVNVKAENKIEITDSYKAVADGRPTELLRTFDALAGSVHFEISAAGANVPEMQSSSPLEGKTVAFKWNADKHEYERSFHDSEGDAKLLEALQEDMDLRVLLPTAEVSEDASWSVPLKDVACLVTPGGDLSMAPENAPNEQDMEKFKAIFAGFSDKFSDLLHGDCKCTYKGSHEEDGVKVAEIAVALDASATVDLTEMLDKLIHAALEENGAGDMVQISLETADLNVDFEGEGTLLWNLKAGRMQSFHVSGDATLEVDLSFGVEVEGKKQNVEASVKLSGSLHEDVATKE